MKIQSISASAIKTFETCPRKFYYEYVLKKRPSTHPAAVMGSCLHKMFENACNAVIKSESADRHDPFFYLESCIKEFAVEDSYHPILKELTKKCVDWGYMDLKNAQGFEVSAEFPLRCGIEVHGFIDRLDIDSELRANIIDLKTQKDTFTKEELKNNWQAMIYFLGTLNDNPMIQGDVKISFWVLRHKIQEVVIPQSRFDEIYNRLNEKTEEILKSDGDQTCPSGLCQFCVASDCIHKKARPDYFGKRDLSQSAKETMEFLKKLRENKNPDKLDSLN